MSTESGPEAKSASRLLVAAARRTPDKGELLALLTRADVPTTVHAAMFHHVAPLAHVRLRDAAGLNDPTLSAEHDSQVFRHLRALAALAWLGQTLGDLTWLVFKGPVLAETYERADLRTYSDLDVLVDRRRLADAVDRLEQAGASLIDKNWSMINRDVRGEMSWLLPGDMPLDLHWTLVNDRHMRAELRVPDDAMIERRVTTTVGATSVSTFDDADTLLYVAMHALRSGGHRLVWTVDVDRIVSARQQDWDLLVERARAARLSVLAGVALARARRMLGTDVPLDVLRALAPALGWRGLVAVADRIRPPELSFRAGPSGRVIAESTRGTTLASLAASRRQLARRFSHASTAPGDDLFAPMGDPHDRELFLRHVATAPAP